MFFMWKSCSSFVCDLCNLNKSLRRYQNESLTIDSYRFFISSSCCILLFSMNMRKKWFFWRIESFVALNVPLKKKIITFAPITKSIERHLFILRFHYSWQRTFDEHEMINFWLEYFFLLFLGGFFAGVIGAAQWTRKKCISRWTGITKCTAHTTTPSSQPTWGPTK